MRKFIVTAVLAALPFIASAQSTAFAKYDNLEGVSTVSVSRKMFEMMGSVETTGNAQAKKFLDALKGLEYIKVYRTNEKKYRKELAGTVQTYLTQYPLEQLVSVNDEKCKVKVYVKQGADESIVKEGLLFIENLDDKEVVVVSFAGNINLKDLGDLEEIKKIK